MKKCSSGLRGAPAKGIDWETGARVQIPPSSPKGDIMEKCKINIYKKINERKCPGPCYCIVATTKYPESERKHICYKRCAKSPLL